MPELDISNLSPAATYLGIITLDFSSLQPQAAYLRRLEPCDAASGGSLADGALAQSAQAFFAGHTEGNRTFHNPQITRFGDLALLEYEPRIEGAVALLGACSGNVLYAGTMVDDGRGEQLHPVEPLRHNALALITTTAAGTPNPTPTIKLNANAGHQLASAGSEAWAAASSTRLAQALLSPACTVLLYLYPRSVNLFDPETADWVVAMHRPPTQ